MINTIVFDIGNVLAHFRWKEFLQECGYEEEVIRKVSNATVNNMLWKEWDRGVRDEAELIELCCRQDLSVEKEIRTIFNNVASIVKEYDYAAELVQRLKQNGYQVYLLSNYSKTHFEQSKSIFEFMKYVDGSIISYQVQMIKPEPGIYKELIQKYDIEPEKAVFLDDLQENLDGAKPFGFHTVQVKNYEQALTDLRMLGVKI